MSTLKVGTIQDHANSNTAISIDSSGRVTLPQRVAFMGKKTDTNQLDTSTNNVSFNVTDLAHASWNGTTFTVPVAGLYRIFFNGHRQSTDGAAVELGIIKNGNMIESAYSLGTTNTRPRVSVEALLVLAVNDAITFRVTQGNVYAGGDTTSSGLMCSGYLIG
tara:strand:- start:26 stop:511 length:486 start_codon:yes stop_codon:yes gene_type:complete